VTWGLQDARHYVYALGPLVAILTLWMIAFLASGTVQAGPSGTKMGGDFAIFLGGAQTLRSGGDPYDRGQLFQSERGLLLRQHVEVPKAQDFIRVGNPPVIFWLLQPLLDAPFRIAAWIWIAALYMLSFGAFLVLLGYLGWRRWAVPVAFFLAMPQTVFAAYYGNLDAIVFAGLVIAIACLPRRPFIGGFVLTVALLKPQVALPIAGLLILFASRSRPRTLAGMSAGTICLVLSSAVVAGFGSVAAWAGSLLGYSRDLSVQPDIASLSGLYVYSMPSVSRLLLQTLLVLSGLGLTWWWWRERRSDVTELKDIAWLWVLWFLISPFAHFHDEVLLAIPVVACLGIDARLVTSRARLLTLYMLALSLLLFPLSRFHTDLQSLALLPVATALFLIARHEYQSSMASSSHSGPATVRTLQEAIG
jgi:Glycosyltransferase family 87